MNRRDRLTQPINTGASEVGTLTSTLSIALSALTSEKGAMDATANNVANVNTPGYSRGTCGSNRERPGGACPAHFRHRSFTVKAREPTRSDPAATHWSGDAISGRVGRLRHRHAAGGGQFPE